MSQPKPLQIYKLENKKYRVDLSAINSILDKVGDRRVAIYSINGPLRNGKSFMIGFFLRSLMCKGSKNWINKQLESTFEFRGGSKRETTGIFMWSEPFILKKNGIEIALLLMDTQGSFDNQTTMQENAIVFALSTLLSSFIIFNIKEQVSEDILQFLQYFAGFARLADEENNDEPFQKLLFLIRDWQMSDYDYGFYDDNHSINGKNFKKDYLDAHESQPMEVKFVHEMILSTFADVGCYLMPHPGAEVARNSNFDPNRVDPDFLEHLHKFVSFILRPEEIVEKKIGGSFITGKQLKIFIERWAGIFKSDELPKTKNVFETTAELQNEMAKTAAIDNYVRRMKNVVITGDNLGLADDLFEDMHRQVLSECIQLYKSFRKIGGKDYEKFYTDKIRDEINVLHQYFVQLNHGNLRIKKIQHTMEQECDKLRKETQENKRKLEEIKDKDAAEKAELLLKIEESDSNFKEMEERHMEEITRLQNELTTTKHQLNNARGEMKRSWFGDLFSGIVSVLGSVTSVIGAVKGVRDAIKSFK